MTPKAEVILFPKHTSQPAQHKRWLSSISSSFEQHLERKGLNLTRQRKKILEHLMSAERHLDTDEIYDALKKKDPTIGRSTVFRTVKML